MLCNAMARGDDGDECIAVRRCCGKSGKCGSLCLVMTRRAVVMTVVMMVKTVIAFGLCCGRVINVVKAVHCDDKRQ